MVILWVNSVFLSLLIANEGLHWWLLLFRCSHPSWGRVVVFIRPPLVCRNFLWLMATLFPGLSLCFASGLSSPGLLCCLAMSLRYADLLYRWFVRPQSVGPRGSWASCLSFALQLALVLRVPVGSFLPYGSHPSRWGHPCGVEASLSSIGTKV